MGKILTGNVLRAIIISLAHCLSSFLFPFRTAFMEMDLPPTGKVRAPRLKRSAPATIYPEILVIVDYDGYRSVIKSKLCFSVSFFFPCLRESVSERVGCVFIVRLHNGDNTEIKKYFVSFWNGVDLRYKLLKGPKVRISIAGIIISRVRNCTRDDCVTLFFDSIIYFVT